MLALKEYLNHNGAEVFLQACDVKQKNEIETVINNVHEKYKAIDVLVNCAGVLGAGVACSAIMEDDSDHMFWM